MDCTNLRRIVTPNSLEFIDSQAFLHCNKLVCGGVIMNASLVSETNNSGINSRVLSNGCLNNYEALIRRPTCKHNNFVFLFRYSIIHLFLFTHN